MAPTTSYPVSSSSSLNPSEFDFLPTIHSLLYRSTLDPINKDALAHKDLVTEAAAVKLKIQKAHSFIDELPDIDRTVEDQRREILTLERKVAKQRMTLQRLAQDVNGTASSSL